MMVTRHTVRQHEQPVYIVSGGVGASGELLVRTALAQFPNVRVPVTVWPYIHTTAQVAEVVERAAEEKAFLVHTLVDRNLRRLLIERARACQVIAVDLLGELLDSLANELQEEPLEQPGRYRELRNGYFRRIDAIEFAVNHDDGQRIAELPQADIVLIGISRVGKTPLSVYLSLQGWKVANIPIVLGMDMPAELAQVERRRIIGLTIEPQQLLRFRRSRQQHLGISGGAYVDMAQLVEELRAANHLFARGGYKVIDVTDKPIETTSEEVIAAVTASPT
ncbi:MAG TPA: pyruvate, water dikinase regulatory protein [Caldilineaceae bacterium]|nr:pyruvate, water dikinase regulatory protein [Caldilineaceae bacterium]